jgi:PAS domain S-box-containing protein
MPDIADSSQADDALRQSEEKFRNFVESTNDWFWEVDENCVYTYVSPRIRDLLGYEPDEVLGRTPFDFMPVDEAASICEAFKDIAGERRRFTLLENTLVHKDGRLVIVETSGVPIIDDMGVLRGYRGTDRDVTERKRAEKAVAESRQLLEAIQDSLSANIAVLDREGNIVAVNESWKRFARENGDPTLSHTGVGVNYLDVCRRATGPMFEGAAEMLAGLQAILAGSDTEIEVEYPCPSTEEKRWFVARATPLRSESGGLVVAHVNITERMLAEQAITERESRYRSLIDTMNEGFATADENYVFTYVNTRFAEMLGYATEDMVAHKMLEFVDEANQAIALAQGDRRHIGEHDHYELAWTAKDGRKVYTLVSPRPILGAEGQFAGSFATLTDITDRREAEEALRKSEEKYRQLIQCANDAILLSELTDDGTPGRFIEVNEVACQRLGYSRDELLTMGPLDIDSPEFVASMPAVTKSLLKHGHCTFEMAHVNRQGLKIPVEVSAHLFELEGKRTVLSIARDITERKQVEQTLRQSEERFRNLFERAADEFLLHDLNGRFVEVNKSTCDVLGYTREEMLQLTVSDIVVGYSPSDLQELWHNLMTVGPVTVQTTHRRKDGSTIPVEGRLSAFDYHDRRLVLAVVRDITERKQAEAALERRGRQMETLARTSRRLNRELDIPTILRQLVASAIELCDAQSCAGGLYIDGKMIFTEYNRQGELIPIRYEFDEGYGVPGRVIQTRRPYVSSDAEHDPHVVQEMREALGFYNLADIPIISRSGRLLGCFETHNTWNRLPFDEVDISMLEGLAASAAIALENAQMLLDREQAEEERRAFEKRLESQKRQFYRETIFSVTDGRLDICDECDAAPYLLTSEIAIEVQTLEQVSDARHRIKDFCREHGLTGERLDGFIIGVGEAITNAVKHGTQGKINAGLVGAYLWVGVQDNGPGIESLILPRAVLLRGFSTKPSLGLGYSMMLDMADRIHLKTDAGGTFVILEKELAEHREELSLRDLPDTWGSVSM